MTKHKPYPTLAKEKYWYDRGVQDGLVGRHKEIQANQARADALWADIKVEQARLAGITQLTRSLHDLIQAAIGGKY